MIPLLPNPTYFSVTQFTTVSPARPPLQTTMNQFYFADDETAANIMQIFGARSIEQVEQKAFNSVVRFDKPDGTPDPTGEVAYQNLVTFLPGSTLYHRDGSTFLTTVGFQENAGLLASYYTRNPESLFPDQIFGSRAAQLAWGALEAKYQWVKQG